MPDPSAQPTSRADLLAQHKMPLMEHLLELRTRLVYALVAVALGVLLAFAFSKQIWVFLADPMTLALQEQGHGSMAVITPLEGIVTYLKVSVLAGFFVASPVVFYQVWQFVAPGLYSSEKKVVLPLVITSSVLFLTGAAFGYFVIFRYAFPFFLSVTEGTADTMLSMQSYLSTVTRLLLAFGFCFQLPVVIFFLARLGLVDARDLIFKFKFAIVGIFVISAIITPPDVLTQLLMSGPLILLYFVGVVVAFFTSTKKRKASA